ncbi:MAG: ester cyclase [Anaerolineaceae bacterium]|nr:ester cyclase [Anaerolineaceae bacterium]
MSAEQLKAIVSRWVEGGWNQGQLALVDELYTTDYMIHDPSTPDFPGGQAAFKQFVADLRTGLPDIQVKIEDIMAEGDKVVWRWRITGTHAGNLKGIPPTGRPVVITGIVLSRFANGKWAEDYVNWDTLGMLQQIGVVPVMA